MSSKRSAFATAAKRIGCSTDEYVANREAGLRWCVRCRVWHPESAFGLDAVRGRRRICNDGPWRVS